ncbi:acyltransferase [Motilimonas eburnea]|nr:acyltransferase [Motilimonas eburnea]MCE2572593.1 acyltransferase [Motilimonas eburnea]
MCLVNKLIKAFFNRKKEGVKYKIGNKKFHNSLIDSLVPSQVEIGDNFISAPNSIILAHDASLYIHCGLYRVEKTKIGDNVFLGAGAIVLPGVYIGNDAIIGAGSVVTKNVEPKTVVAGNPAKFVCTVEEYISRCRKKNTLYEPPVGFKKQFSNEKIDVLDIENFDKTIEMKVRANES